MTAPNTCLNKAKSAPQPRDALFTTNTTNVNAKKQISTARALLCQAGGQRLHVAEDGAFFVSTPFGQITKFDSLAALEEHVARGAR